LIGTKTLKDVFSHLANASALNSRLSSEKIESIKSQKVPHPSYGTDLTPSHFLLFGHLKEKPRGM
jgi:hypothetical protein